MTDYLHEYKLFRHDPKIFNEIFNFQALIVRNLKIISFSDIIRINTEFFIAE